MTLRPGHLIIAAALSAAALGSGCSHMLWHSNSPPLAAIEEPRAVPSTDLGRSSPYHVQQTDEVAKPHGLAGSFIEAPVQPVVNSTPPASIDPPQTPAASLSTKTEPQRAEEPLVGALRCLLEKHPDAAIELLKQYDALNQDMLLGMLALAARLTERSLDQATPQEAAIVLEQLNSLTVLLRPLAALTIEKMCFCREVARFGSYEPLSENHGFQAGREGKSGEQVLLYIELKHFTSRPVNGQFNTRLASTLEIRDLQGKTVWRRDFPADQPDRSYTMRHDYFIAYRFSVPPSLPPGQYRLWIEARDLSGASGPDLPPHRIARRSLPFPIIPAGVARTTSARVNH